MSQLLEKQHQRGLISDALWSYGTQPLTVPRAAFEVWMPLPAFLAALPIWMAYYEKALAGRKDTEWEPPPGIHFARVHPATLMDRLMFTGVTADVWIEKGKLPTQGAIYRAKKEGQEPRAGR